MKPFYGEINMGNAVYSTPIVADNVLYICESHPLVRDRGSARSPSRPPRSRQTKKQKPAAGIEKSKTWEH